MLVSCNVSGAELQMSRLRRSAWRRSNLASANFCTAGIVWCQWTSAGSVMVSSVHSSTVFIVSSMESGRPQAFAGGGLWATYTDRGTSCHTGVAKNNMELWTSCQVVGCTKG